MAREDVNIKVSANVAEMIQLWKQMDEGPEGFARAVQGMSQRGRESAKSLGDEVLGMVGKWVSVASAVAMVTKEINDQIAAERRLREERNQSTNQTDDLFNRFQVQASVAPGAQADQLRTQLLSIAANRRVAPDVAIPSATQLISSGSTVNELIAGGGLDAFLQTLVTTNASGGNADPTQLAKAMVMYLTSHGQRPTGENILQSGSAVQRLFQGTNLQIANLARFAPEVATISKFAGTGPVENLAYFSQFLDTMDESRGATAFRSGVVSLATAGANMEKTRGLKMLGLAPGDVDFQGESFADVQKRLTRAFGQLPGDQKNVAAKLLFGQEALGFYNVLLNDQAIAEGQRRIGLASDQAGFQETLAIAESSRGASARQAESLAAGALYDPNELDPDVVRKRIQALTAELGMSRGYQASVLKRFDDPTGPDSWWTTGGRAWLAAGRIERVSGITDGSRHMERQEALEAITGQREIRIRLTGPDGRDIPHEVDAVGIQER